MTALPRKRRQPQQRTQAQPDHGTDATRQHLKPPPWHKADQPLQWAAQELEFTWRILAGHSLAQALDPDHLARAGAPDATRYQQLLEQRYRRWTTEIKQRRISLSHLVDVIMFHSQLSHHIRSTRDGLACYAELCYGWKPS